MNPEELNTIKNRYASWRDNPIVDDINALIREVESLRQEDSLKRSEAFMDLFDEILKVINRHGLLHIETIGVLELLKINTQLNQIRKVISPEFEDFLRKKQNEKET